MKPRKRKLKPSNERYAIFREVAGQNPGEVSLQVVKLCGNKSSQKHDLTKLRAAWPTVKLSTGMVTLTKD